MKNLFSGFLLSALVHTGLLSGVIYLNKKETKKELSEEKVTLTVGVFQDNIEPIVKTPVQEDLLSAPIPPVPPVVKNTKKPDIQEAKKQLNVEDSPPKNIQASEIVTDKIIPPTKIASVSPKLLETQVEPKPVVTPKPKPVKKVKIKIKKKPVKKLPRKKPKTKVIIKKVVKPKIKKKKKVKPPVRKTIIKKKLLIKPKKIATKRVKPQVRKAVSKPVNRVIKQNNKRTKQATRNKYVKPVNVIKRGSPHKAKRITQAVKRGSSGISLSRQYKSRLQRIISVYSKKHYPKRAKKRGEQGKVTVAFTVAYNGMIQNIRIIKSSNSRSLDAAAVKAIKHSSGKLPYFKGMDKKTLNLNITLTYVLR